MTTFTSVEGVAAFVVALPRTSPRRIVGIAGAPGAGKSTIAATLVALLGSAALLPMDGYHYPQSKLVALGRRERMGAADTFDVESFVETLRQIRASDKVVFAPSFSREREEPVPSSIVIGPATQTIVVEGNYLLLDSGAWSEVAALLDATFFVDLDDDIRRSRLVERHVRFGKSEADARTWAFGPDESNARIIAATRGRAQHFLAL